MQRWKSGLSGAWLRVQYVAIILWARPWFRRVTIGFGVMLMVVIGLQFAYPANRALPFTRVGETAVGWKTQDELVPLLEETFADTSVTLQAASRSETIKLSDVGATLDVGATASQLVVYPWWQRLVPFSALFIQPQSRHLAVTFNDTRLSEAATSLATKLHSDPTNGVVLVDNTGKVTVTEAKDGVTVSATTVTEALKSGSFALGSTTITLAPELKAPSITNEMVATVKARLNSVIKTKLVLQNSMDASATYTPDAKTIASWITISDTLELGLDASAVADYATVAAKKTLIAAGTTTVTVVDGIEKGRKTGTSGRAVDADALSKSVYDTLFSGGSAVVPLTFKTIAPTIVYNRSYTSSQQALQAYVDEVAKGKYIEIAIKQLNGAGWSASTGASKSVVSASTYKLYISLLLFDKIDDNKIEWSDAIQGTTVEGCLYNTIVYSANNCAEQWINEWGRTNINSALYAKGFSRATTFTAVDATHTSAADLQKLLIGLHSKTLFSGSDASRLIGLMKQQVYRKGIPAGSVGVVADKVGFLWDYLNDAAIVYHPRGTYVLVVMTQGQSWGTIAEITRQLEKIMYP